MSTCDRVLGIAKIASFPLLREASKDSGAQCVV